MKLVRDPGCEDCGLCKTAEYVCLLGQGPIPCDVMVVGEAPGHREDESGKPFVGKAGGVLEELLPVDRSEIYITNAVRCRPPDNRTPRKSEINACSRWMKAEIRAVKPKYVLILGNVPLQALLGIKGIKAARGMPIERDGILYFPTFHPSYILHAESAGDMRVRKTVRSDIETFFKIVDQGGIGKERGLNYKIVTDANLWQALRDIKACPDPDFDTETSGLRHFEPGFHVVSVGISTETTQWCFPLRHPQHSWSRNRKRQEEIVRLLTSVLRGKELSAHNGKFDTLAMAVSYDVWWYCDFDTMLAHYNVDENSNHSLDFLAQLFFGAISWDIPLEEKHGNGSLDKHCRYLGLDVYYLRKLKKLLKKKLAEDEPTEKLFYRLTMPVSRMYTDIEYHGVWINREKLAETRAYYVKQADRALAELNRLIPDKREWKDKKTKAWRTGVNWGSPQQVAEVLFKRLKLKPLDKTGKGADSTSESVLLRLASQHKVPKLILEYREAQKNVGTFCDGWSNLAIKNRLHPTFKLMGTVTGRPSCEEPNLQQTPRNPLLRNVIDAPLGWILLEVDQSQVEMRVAAEMADERAMKLIFQTGGDIHVKTAEEVVGVLNPTKDERKKAKAVGFGYLFGMWWKKFIIYARDNYGLDIGEREAQESRKRFFRTYPALDPWHKKQKRFANRYGYVRNLIGRLRRLPAAMARDDSMECREAERQAINSPVQSFASDVTLMGALAIHGDREHTPDDPRHVKPGIPYRIYHLVGSIHDALLGECVVRMQKLVAAKIKRLMENPPLLTEVFKVEMSVPFVAETKSGPWGSE
jgi:uracil-DNA glycosylase family 4